MKNGWNQTQTKTAGLSAPSRRQTRLLGSIQVGSFRVPCSEPAGPRWRKRSINKNAETSKQMPTSGRGKSEQALVFVRRGPAIFGNISTGDPDLRPGSANAFFDKAPDNLGFAAAETTVFENIIQIGVIERMESKFDPGIALAFLRGVLGVRHVSDTKY
jgi:hypothetical protein